MSALLSGFLKALTVIAVIAGAMVVTSFEADAKRIKIGGGNTHVVPVPRSKSAEDGKTSDDQAAATAAPIDTKQQDAQRAEAFEHAKRKIAAEKSGEGRATAQVNTSATVGAEDGVVCLAGCWRRN